MKGGITIDGAIEFIKNDLSENVYIDNSKHKKAMKLAIEALKAVKKRQEHNPNLPHLLLPGQIKE